jgi:hypothetical protein
MKEHEDEVIRPGDLVEIVDSMLPLMVEGLRFEEAYLVAAVSNEPSHQGIPGPWIEIDGVHPVDMEHFVIRSNHARCFRKIHPDGFKKGDKVLDLINLPVHV